MLRTCFECITGAIGPIGEGNQSRANGDVQNAYAPVNLENSTNMFQLPRMLNDNDTIKVVGSLMNNPQNLTVSIASAQSTDVPCQICFDFIKNNITIQTITSGYSNILDEKEYQMHLYFSVQNGDKSNFEITFYLDAGELNVIVNKNHLHRVPLEHNLEDLRYINLSGDIEKVHSFAVHFA